MAVPRAQPSGLFGSGFAPAAAHPLDIGSIIDAATNGAASLLHGAYVRKVAERNYAAQMAQRQAEIAQRTFENSQSLERTRLANEQHTFENSQSLERTRLENEQHTFERQKADRDYELRKHELDQKRREAGIDPAKQIVPPSPIAAGGITLPETYNPEHDVALQRGKALRASPTYKTPAETPGTPEHLAAVTAEAEARAKATAKYRPPKSDFEIASQRIAVRQAVQEARTRYIEGDKARMGRGALPPLQAAQKAIEDAREVFGDAAVQDAMGIKPPRLNKPVTQPTTPRTQVEPAPWQVAPGAPAASSSFLKSPTLAQPAPAAATTKTAPAVAPLARPTPAATVRPLAEPTVKKPAAPADRNLTPVPKPAIPKLPPSVDQVRYGKDPEYKAWVDNKLGVGKP